MVVIGVVLVVFLALDVPALWRMWHTVARGRRPAAIAAAVRSPWLPPVLRPLVAIWWFGHFALAAASAGMMEFMALGPSSEVETKAGAGIIGFGMCMAFAFSANAYLMLAVAAMTRNDRTLAGVWRYRWCTDLAISAVVLMVVHWQRGG